MPSTLYDDDVLIWSERQAALLRALRSRRDLPNELDIDNVAEEIESVGRDQLRAVESLLVQSLVHAIKIVALPNADPARGWADEMLNLQTQAVARLTPSLPNRVDLPTIWRRAAQQATKSLRIWGDPVPELPDACPVPLSSLLSENFDPEEVFNLIKGAISGTVGTKD